MDSHAFSVLFAVSYLGRGGHLPNAIVLAFVDFKRTIGAGI